MTATKPKLSDTEQALLLQRLQRARTKKPKTETTIRPMPPDKPIPLSFSQQRLWFLYQWDPTDPSYNIPLAWRLAGPLNVTALQAALDQLVARHQALRVRFVVGAEVTLELQPDPINFPWDLIDLRDLPTAAREAEARRLAAEEGRRSFVLEQELPIRARLICLSDTDYILLITLHHIVADGWSVRVLRAELAQLYAAFDKDKPLSLPDLPIQYHDFACWQREWLQGEVVARQLGYWQTQLAGIPHVLDLPFDRPRPQVLTHQGATLHFQLDRALSQAVYASAQREEVTPFMLLLAAYQVLLHRYTAQDDIVVGTPIAGRNRAETEGLIGCFINTLALRTRFAQGQTVRELLHAVRETTISAYSHQDLPFERLLEELQPARDLRHTPVFQSMIVFDRLSDTGGLNLPGLRVEPLGAHRDTAKFDLTLTLRDYRDSIAGALTYNTALFNPETVERLQGHFEVLLRGMLAQPEQRVADLPLLRDAERNQLLRAWNETGRAYPGANRCLPELFEAQVEQTPDEIAVICEEDCYTYRELNQRANQLAHFLRAQGVGPEVCVGLFMERSREIIVGLLGILKAGGAYVPLDPAYPADRLRVILTSAQTPILLTQSHLAADLPELGDLRVVLADQDWEVIADYPEDNPPVNVRLDNLMYVLFTSGSTGQPKGVAVQQRSYLNYLDGFLERIDVPAGLSYALVSTFAADLGTPMIYGALCTGGTLHVIPYERAIDPEAIANYFEQHRIDVLKLVPSHFEAWLTAADPARVVPQARLILAGEASHWDTIERVRQLRPEVVIQNHYGPTETTVSVLAYPVPEQVPENPPATVPLGRPLGNIRTYVLDANLRPVPQGVSGELYLGGAGLARGYLGRPDLTAERFVPDPFSQEPGERLYRTGDRVRYLSGGVIEFLGRVDFQVKLRGYRIEPEEIASLLGGYPNVQDAAVILREDVPGEKQLVAYVVPHDSLGEIGFVGALRDDLRQQVPDYMVPTAFVELAALPLTPNGKIDRQALPVPASRQAATGAHTFVAPRSALESRLVTIWGEILGVEQVGLDDNFFDLGGESFKAIRVVRQIDEGLRVIELFKHPTVRQLAEYLAGEHIKSAGLLHEFTAPVPEAEKIANLVCIPYGGGSSVVYKALADALPAGYALYSVEIPGHDFSQPDEVLLPLNETARRCVDEISKDISGPIVLYGHCVGGALALRIAYLLEAAGVDLLGVVMGGTFPSPRLPGRFLGFLDRFFTNERWTSDRHFRDFLVATGGLPDLPPAEQNFVVRGMRHDAGQATDYYTALHAQENSEQLQAPILCVVGQQDRASRFYQERFREWESFSPQVSLAEIPDAGHYFLKYQAKQLAEAITNQVPIWQQPPPAQFLPEQLDGAVALADGRKVESSIRPSLSLFFWVVLGQLVSIIGTGLSDFALGIWVYQQTNSVSLLGLITAFTLLPRIVVLPFAGAVADRFDRRQVILISDSVAGLRTLILVLLLWTGSLEIWHICALSALGAMANAFQRPAYLAAVAQLVPKRYLGQANGIVQLGGAISDLLAPLLGGALVVLIGLRGIVLIDFATFLFAAFILLVVRFPDTMFLREEEPMLKAILGGWRFIMRRRSLVVMVIFFIAFNYVNNIAQVLFTPIVLTVGTPALVGTALSIAGLGVLLGSIVMGVWGGTKRRADGMIGSGILVGLAIAIMGIRPVPALIVIGLFCFGLGMTLLNAHWQTMIQTKVGLELQGRVLATNQMLAIILTPLGALTAGPVVDKVFAPLLAGEHIPSFLAAWLVGTGVSRDIGLTMLLLGSSLAIWSILGLRYRPLRYLEDDLPDALPDSVITVDKDCLQEQADRRLMD